MLSLSWSLYRKHRHMILYGVIGVSAMVVDLGFFLFFYNIIDIAPVVSTIFSVGISMVYAFVLNVIFNFKTKDFIVSRFVSYIFVSLSGMVVSVVLVKGLTLFDWDGNLAKVISLPPIVIMQYVINRRITFQSRQRGGVTNTEPALIVSKALVPRSIAIIGGGFTGLTAAYRLAERGHKVTVYEAQAELGGLVAGFEIDGQSLERAYHFLYKTDRSIINLANEIGVGHKLHFYPSSVSIYHEGKIYPFMTPRDLLTFKPLSLIDRVRAGLVAVYLSKVTNWRPFARVTAHEWMTKWAGKAVTRVIWEPILRGKFFNYYDKIAMSYLWSRVYVRANSKDKGDVTEKLGYFDGGFQTFIKQLVTRCQDLGVTIHTKTAPTQLISRHHYTEVLVAGRSEKYDAVLSTIPSYVFRRLIEHGNHTGGPVPKDRLELLSAVEYLGAVIWVFTTDTKLSDYYWHNINDDDIPFLVVLGLTALIGSDKFKGKHVYYIGAYLPHDHHYFSASDEAIRADWEAGLRRVFPHFRSEMIGSSNIFKFKNAQHIVETDYEQKIPPYRSAVPGLYLANFTQIFPDDRGTNYAVSEGERVARLIDEDLT